MKKDLQNILQINTKDGNHVFACRGSDRRYREGIFQALILDKEYYDATYGRFKKLELFEGE